MATQKKSDDTRGLVVNDRFEDRDRRGGPDPRVLRVVEVVVDGKKFSTVDRARALRAKVLCENVAGGRRTWIRGRRLLSSDYARVELRVQNGRLVNVRVDAESET